MSGLPPFVRTVLETLESSGHPAYLAGGPVRDIVMGKVPQDWDIATAAAPEVVQGLFAKTVPTGIRHGTVTVVMDGQCRMKGAGHVEVTTFRRDGAYADHRRPERVDFVTDLQEDLARRDFTMNAMALDLRGVLIDPFGGRIDIEAKRVRAVGDSAVRFEEDALRMLRAFRFSAQLGFEIDAAVLEAVHAKHHLTANLSAERVRDEVEKILLSERPDVLADVLACGLLAGYAAGGRVPLLYEMGRVANQKTARWAAFACGGGELRAFRLDNKTLATAAAAAELAPDLPLDIVELKRLLARHGLDAIRCAAEVAVLFGRAEALQVLEGIVQSGACYSLDTLAVSGADLIAVGVPPGSGLGDVLGRLLEYVIAHPTANERGLLLGMVQDMRIS